MCLIKTFLSQENAGTVACVVLALEVAQAMGRYAGSGCGEWEAGTQTTAKPQVARGKKRFTLPGRNDDAGHRVERTIESCFHRPGPSRPGAFVACPWPVPDGFGPRGSNGYIRA